MHFKGSFVKKTVTIPSDPLKYPTGEGGSDLRLGREKDHHEIVFRMKRGEKIKNKEDRIRNHKHHDIQCNWSNVCSSVHE